VCVRARVCVTERKREGTIVCTRVQGGGRIAMHMPAPTVPCPARPTSRRGRRARACTQLRVACSGAPQIALALVALEAYNREGAPQRSGNSTTFMFQPYFNPAVASKFMPGVYATTPGQVRHAQGGRAWTPPGSTACMRGCLPDT
jgi:hypothetical protein